MLTHTAIFLIRLYQRLVSPGLPACCIYAPSCSRYAVEALEQHGFWRGSWFALRRLVRCGPWGVGGEDPVPRGPAGGRPVPARGEEWIGVPSSRLF